MARQKISPGSDLTGNMLIAARGYVASARIVYEVGDNADPDLESVYTIVLLCGLAAELAFKGAYIKRGGPPASARYSIGPDLRKAEMLARDWGYKPSRPNSAQLVDQLADAYLAVSTRRYETRLDVSGFDAASVLAWTEQLVADVDECEALAEKYPLPAFLA